MCIANWVGCLFSKCGWALHTYEFVFPTESTFFSGLRNLYFSTKEQRDILRCASYLFCFLFFVHGSLDGVVPLCPSSVSFGAESDENVLRCAVIRKKKMPSWPSIIALPGGFCLMVFHLFIYASRSRGSCRRFFLFLLHVLFFLLRHFNCFCMLPLEKIYTRTQTHLFFCAYASAHSTSLRVSTST